MKTKAFFIFLMALVVVALACGTPAPAGEPVRISPTSHPWEVKALVTGGDQSVSESTAPQNGIAVTFFVSATEGQQPEQIRVEMGGNVYSISPGQQVVIPEDLADFSEIDIYWGDRKFRFDYLQAVVGGVNSYEYFFEEVQE